MSKLPPKRIAGAMSSRRLVRFKSRFDPPNGGWNKGYILDSGPKFFLLAAVNGEVRLDGFSCFRILDVRKLEFEPYAAFIEAALKKRGERRPRKPPISLASVEDLLRSANKAFPLVTIRSEIKDRDVCHIGKAEALTRGQCWLREIGCDAQWEEAATAHSLRGITRVDVGGGYEEALYLVGGEPTPIGGKWEE
jgi:hypothetical protein